MIVLQEQRRTANEVRDHLVRVKQAFENVVLKHEEYTNLIIEDEDFQTEEKWLDDCQNDFLKLDNEAKSYVEKISLTNSETHVVEESAGPSLTYKLGGKCPPSPPLCPPPRNHFLPPQEKSLLLNLYKQTGKNNK